MVSVAQTVTEGTMKRLMVACSVVALTGCVAPGMGGMTDPVGMATNASMADSTAQMEAQASNMMAAQAAAEAAAARPGDEALSCEALQTEMQTTMNDPKVQASIASMGASAQTQMDKMKSAQAGALAGAATTSALGIAGSFIPGLSWLSQGAMMAQQASIAGQMNEANKTRAQMMGDITSVMPQLYRGQRVYDLATAKNCAFVNESKPT
jgi:hypothetical protein